VNLAVSRLGIKSEPLLISQRPNVINKLDGVLNVPCTKIAEELDNPIGKVTDKVLGWSVTGENVL
jgi:hypothetical protein